MQTFFNNPQLKANLLEEIKKHQEADEIAQGVYEKIENGKLKLCAVGCSLYSLNTHYGKNVSTSDHNAYETELGIPLILGTIYKVTLIRYCNHITNLL